MFWRKIPCFCVCTESYKSGHIYGGTIKRYYTRYYKNPSMCPRKPAWVVHGPISLLCPTQQYPQNVAGASQASSCSTLSSHAVQGDQTFVLQTGSYVLKNSSSCVSLIRCSGLQKRQHLWCFFLTEVTDFRAYWMNHLLTHFSQCTPRKLDSKGLAGPKH